MIEKLFKSLSLKIVNVLWTYHDNIQGLNWMFQGYFLYTYNTKPLSFNEIYKKSNTLDLYLEIPLH